MRVGKLFFLVVVSLLIASCGRDSNFNGMYAGQDQSSRWGAVSTNTVTVTLYQNGSNVTGNFIETPATGMQPMSGTVTGVSSGNTLTQISISFAGQSNCTTPLVGTGMQNNQVLTLNLTGCGGADTITLQKRQ